jgi:hypothetical protein
MVSRKKTRRITVAVLTAASGATVKGGWMENHKIRLLPNGFECSCGEKTLLKYIPENLVIQSLAVQHWAKVGKLPGVNGSAAQRSR